MVLPLAATAGDTFKPLLWLGFECKSFLGGFISYCRIYRSRAAAFETGARAGRVGAPVVWASLPHSAGHVNSRNKSARAGAWWSARIMFLSAGSLSRTVPISSSSSRSGFHSGKCENAGSPYLVATPAIGPDVTREGQEKEWLLSTTAYPKKP